MNIRGMENNIDLGIDSSDLSRVDPTSDRIVMKVFSSQSLETVEMNITSYLSTIRPVDILKISIASIPTRMSRFGEDVRYEYDYKVVIWYLE